MTEPTCSPAFIIGAPRSGTSWFQFLIGAHPLVATPQEIDLFSRYIPLVWDAWEHELGRPPEARIAGLITALTQEEFEHQLRSFAAGVHERILAMKPGATVVLEKDPPYSLHVPLINRLLPEARFLHLIRDGRDVAVSMMASSRSWNQWLPGTVREAASTWREYVEAALQASDFHGRYLEVRYEALVEDGAAELLRVFDFLGLEADIELCEQISDTNRFSALAKRRELSPSIAFGGEALRTFGRPPEPEGFLRRGRAGDWATAMSRRQVRIFDEVAGELLACLGYETPGAAGVRVRGIPLRPLRRLDNLLRGGARRLGWRLQSWGAQ